MTKAVIVSDSSSLIIGTKAGLLDAMCKEFQIVIPEKVFEETVIAGRELQKIDALEIWNSVKEKKIKLKKTRAMKNQKVAYWLDEFALDAGEKQAIALYFQTKAKMLLVDDRQAIKTAKLLGIRWVTIPGIIVAFSDRKIVSKEKAVEALKIAQDEGRYKIGFINEAFKKIKGGRK